MQFIDTTKLELLQTNANSIKSDCLFRYAPSDYKVRICIDMDGVLAKWRGNNEEYESSIYGKQFFHVEHLYHEGYFLELPPNMNVVKAVTRLAQNADKQGISIAVFSSYLPDSRFALEEKEQWVDKYLPFIKERIFTPCGISKASQIKADSSDWFLIDDLTENIRGFQEAGMSGIKMLNGINDTHRSWTGLRVDMNDPELDMSILDAVHKIMEERLMK